MSLAAASAVERTVDIPPVLSCAFTAYGFSTRARLADGGAIGIVEGGSGACAAGADVWIR